MSVVAELTIYATLVSLGAVLVAVGAVLGLMWVLGAVMGRIERRELRRITTTEYGENRYGEA